MPPFNQVLYPRVTGFIHIFNEMNKSKQIDCVQDVTVAYRGGFIPESEKDFITGKLPHEIHFYIERFDAKSLLNNNEDDSEEGQVQRNKLLESWLNERWRKKEKFLAKCIFFF